MVAALGKTNLNSEFKILPPTCFEMHQIKINLKCATNGLCSLYLHQQSAYTRCTLCPQHICSKLRLQRQKQLKIHTNKYIKKWNIQICLYLHQQSTLQMHVMWWGRQHIWVNFPRTGKIVKIWLCTGYFRILNLSKS